MIAKIPLCLGDWLAWGMENGGWGLSPPGGAGPNPPQDMAQDREWDKGPFPPRGPVSNLALGGGGLSGMFRWRGGVLLLYCPQTDSD